MIYSTYYESSIKDSKYIAEVDELIYNFEIFKTLTINPIYDKISNEIDDIMNNFILAAVRVLDEERHKIIVT